MKYYLSVLALLALPACIGGGGADVTMDVTPSAPSLPMNTDFGVLMNGVRTANTPGIQELTYDSRVGQAAQSHANDMVINNYFSISIPGSDNGSGAERDIGDRVTAQGYDWVDIAPLIERGDYTLAEALAEFGEVECDAGSTKCIDRTNFADFGIAKAGSGANQKWVLVLTEPTPP